MGLMMTDSTDFIREIKIENLNERAVAPKILQERKVAIFDLCSGNTFAVLPRSGFPAPCGPYDLILRLRDHHAIFDITDKEEREVLAVHVSMTQFRESLKSYGAICRQYYDAVRRRPHDVIEQTDRIRRVIHDQGAEQLQERLKDKVDIDFETARGLFTLLYAAQPSR